MPAAIARCGRGRQPSRSWPPPAAPVPAAEATVGTGECTDGSGCGGRLDRDRDNLISPQEWDDAFNAADTDHDGVVSQTEFEAAGRELGRWWTRV